MTFVLFRLDIMNGLLFESASFEPKSQLENNRAELLVLNQQAEKPVKASMAAKLLLRNWSFPTVKKDLSCLLGW